MKFRLLFAAIALFAPCAVAAAEPDAKTEVVYRTKPNDTLYDLARRYFVRQADYRIVQTLNHVTTPEHLPPNRNLRVPVALLRGAPVQAVILSFSGDVTVSGARARPGMALNEGARLQTGASSFLTIKASDGSRVSMPSQSVMLLSRMRRILLTDGLDQEFTVERGRVQTSVMPQTNPNSQYLLRTPIAVSAVRGTEFRVAYGDGPSLTEVLGGHVAVGQPGAANPTSIPPGIGAALSADGGMATEKLLPPPALAGPMPVQSDEQVRFVFAPVPGAVRYRVQLARDAAFNEVFADADSTTPEVTVDQVADGHYFARATAFSATKFEGLPAVYPFDRRLRSITGDASELPDGTLRFTWTIRGGDDRAAHFQIYPYAGTRPLLDGTGMAGNMATVRSLPPGSYRWRVGLPVDADGTPELWTPLMRVDVVPPER